MLKPVERILRVITVAGLFFVAGALAVRPYLEGGYRGVLETGWGPALMLGLAGLVAVLFVLVLTRPQLIGASNWLVSLFTVAFVCISAQVIGLVIYGTMLLLEDSSGLAWMVSLPVTFFSVIITTYYIRYVIRTVIRR